MTPTFSTVWLLAFLYIAPCQAYKKLAFSHWFPDSGYHFRPLLLPDAPCYGAYQAYLDGTINTTFYTSVGTIDNSDIHVRQVIECLLQNSSESVKSWMASSEVLLGLLPTILTILGSSSLELSLLYIRRPLLASMISCALPGVMPSRTREYREVSDLLRPEEKDYRVRRIQGTVRQTCITVLEYVVVLGAVANIVYVTWQLTVCAVPGFRAQQYWMISAWIIVAPIVHIMQAIVLRLRIRYDAKPPEETNLYVDDDADLSRTSTTRNPFKDEFTLSSKQSLATLKMRGESFVFILLSWLTSLSATVHIIFGTLVLSSTLFVNILDSLGVVGRFLVSVVVCRIVILYEIDGMKKSILTGETMAHGSKHDKHTSVHAEPKIVKLR